MPDTIPSSWRQTGRSSTVVSIEDRAKLAGYQAAVDPPRGVDFFLGCAANGQFLKI
jgi:hypothetical protein